MEYVSHSEKETNDIGRQIAEKLVSSNQNPVVVCLFGDLGAGKTNLTKGIADYFGVDRNVISPTYVIQKIYEIKKEGQFNKLVHIDAYRLKDESELPPLKWNDYLSEKGSFIVVEWPENVKDNLPETVFKIKIESPDETTRIFKLEDGN